MSNSMPDNVFETTTTTGTGAYTPAGAVTGSRTFLSALGAGTVANVQYVCRDDNNTEVGIGTWNGSTLTRDTILYSTNSNAAVNWGTGTRNLFITISSEICLKELATDVASTGTPITSLDHTGCLTVRITGSTATTIQGIAAPKGSKLLLIQSPSTAVVTLKHQNTSASSADRMILPGATDYTVIAGGFVLLTYDITQSRWLEVLSTNLSNYMTTSLATQIALAGEIKIYAGTSLPTGWLWCDGANVSRSTYAALFAAISTTFGVGDGSTTFGLPDLRGRMPLGKDNMGGSAASRVTTAGSSVDGATLGAVGGSQYLHGHTHTYNYRAGYPAGDGSSSAYWTGDSTANTGSTGSGSSQNMPPVQVVNYIIKT